MKNIFKKQFKNNLKNIYKFFIFVLLIIFCLTKTGFAKLDICKDKNNKDYYCINSCKTPSSVKITSACKNPEQGKEIVDTTFTGQDGCGFKTFNTDKFKMEKTFYEDLKKLNEDYKKQFGRDLKIVSAYRNDEIQLCIWKKENCTTITSCQGRVGVPCSLGADHPSNHASGQAVDFSSETLGGCSNKTIKVSSCKSKEFEWLIKNAKKYDIIGGRLKNDIVHFSRTGR